MRVGIAFLLIASAGWAGCFDHLGGLERPEIFDVPASAVSGDPTYAYQRSPEQDSVASPVIIKPGLVAAWEGTCPCPEYRFVADVDSESAPPGWLDVRVRWDGTQVSQLNMKITRLNGQPLAQGERGFDDALARLWAPNSGDYIVSILGQGDFTATVRFGTLAVPDQGDLLPNLVEIPPTAPGIGGECEITEQVEQGAQVCMRFGNAVANPGHGALQVRLTVDQAATAIAPLGGHFVQEIRQVDGTVRSHPVGPASFHVAHGHWHYAGLALFELYAVNEATGLRGALASSHSKTGFCFLDWDEMPENTTVPAQQERAETDCLVPGAGASWTNGISRGWYDFYESALADQYVEVSNVPDGRYELVVTADPGNTLEELDETDNQASRLIEIKGGVVHTIQERGHYRLQEADAGF